MAFSKQEQRTHVELWRESGLNKAAYCREANIRYHTFHSWVSKYPPVVSKPEGTDEEFLELRPGGNTFSRSIVAELDPQSGRWLIHASASPEWAARLMRICTPC